jgi:hypothetical protein
VNVSFFERRNTLYNSNIGIYITKVNFSSDTASFFATLPPKQRNPKPVNLLLIFNKLLSKTSISVGYYKCFILLKK